MRSWQDCLGLLAWLALASPALGGRASDASTIVWAIEAHYRGVRTLKATFLERYWESQNLRIESGTAYFSRPGRMRWEYEEPELKTFLADGKTVWFYVPADRTVTRAKLKESADWRTPLALLTGKAQLSRFCGRVELADIRVTAAENVGLRCLPKSAKEGFEEVLLEVDEAYRLVRVLVREAGGVETEFRFADWAENIPLREALFHFQPPPGTAIVDEASIAAPFR